MKIVNLAVAGLLSLLATTANSTTVFAPTDGDVNFLFGSLSGYELYMFDDDDAGNYGGSGVDSLPIPVPSIVGIAGPSFVGDYIATSEVGATLTLTDTDQFVLALFDGTTWYENTATYVGANSYTVEFDTESGSVLTIDVEVIPEVPVPAAAWLFGSGLIGLVGIARRRV